MPFTFYAQQGEDVYTLYNFINKPVSDGIFVEIGGFDGILIEPTTQFYKMKANRPMCDCYNLAVAKAKSKVKFIGDHATAGLVETMAESFKNGWHKKSTEYEVDAEPFSDILKRSQIKYIDFMTIDVEGVEQVVLETFDFSIPVYVIAIELDNHNPEKDEKCRYMLRSNGFTFKKRITSNEFWVNETYFRKNQLKSSTTKVPTFNSIYELGRFPFLERHLIKEVEEALRS
jgi:FkbM family methyltransferase